MKALETPEEKRSRRIKKKEEKEKRKRAEMGWDQEMMVSKVTWRHNDIITTSYLTRGTQMLTIHLVTNTYWTRSSGTRSCQAPPTSCLTYRSRKGIKKQLRLI